MSRYHLSTGATIGRALIASAGGYVAALGFTIGFTAILTRLAAMPRADAYVIAAMLAFLVWTLSVIVAYAATTAWRATAWVLGSGLALAALGWALGPLPAPVL